jgi:cytochrome c
LKIENQSDAGMKGFFQWESRKGGVLSTVNDVDRQGATRFNTSKESHHKGGYGMKRLFVFALIAVLGISFSSSAMARGMADEAKSMVQEGADYIKANGKEKSIEQFNNPAGKFVRGDLYIFVYALTDGTMLAHPINPKLVGQNLTNVPDPDGKLYRKDILELAKAKGDGWVEYKYLNPETKKMEDKTTYLLKVDDMILCCGVYK